MADKNLVYPICLRARNQAYFLLWRDGGSKPDEYVTFPNSMNLIVENDISLLRARAEAINLMFIADEPTCVDIDAMMKAIARVGNKPCSTLAASHILDGWNNLEDLARSVKINISEFGRVDELRRIYDKLFLGNNLPAITPSGQAYFPVFSAAERQLMRKYLRSLWCVVAEKMGISL